MWYVSQIGGATTLHIENAQLPSVNLIIWGGDKAWRFLTKKGARRYLEIMAAQKRRTHLCPAKKKCRNGNLCKVCSCASAALHSPGFFPDSTFLDLHGIDYFDIIQRAGDLVYVNAGIPYCVVNLNSNLAESCNLLPRVMLPSLGTDLLCACHPDHGGRSLKD